MHARHDGDMTVYLLLVSCQANPVMKTHEIDEKIKPFRLVKYFTFTSLIVIFGGTLVLTLLNTHWARALQREKSEDYAHVLIENLNHQVFLQFVLPVALKYRQIQLRNKEQFERMDKVVRSTLHSFRVERVNIYDREKNIISYSFEKRLVGRENIGGTGYYKAREGQSTSKLIQRGNFWQILLGFPKESYLVTFAPLRAEKPLARISGPVLGVVEIVQDLTQDYQTIFRFQILVVITCAIVMGTIFIVLRFLVKRGEKIIEKRALERLRLKEQLNRAERLSALGEMVAGVSHEIRNPLGIIKSSAELLKKKIAQIDPANSIPDIIVEEAGRLNNIISDFLNYAKPRAPNLMPCHLEEIIEKNLKFLEPQIQQQNHQIVTSYAHQVPAIDADADMLYQAFLNLLINAMQAMPDGGNIHVALQAENGQVQMLIEDEGGGIAVETLEKIWDPFFTTKEEGTGLGLGIVKNIIESHKGHIGIENRSEGGTRVIVALPISQGDS